jgi:beta-fructofuranosidase
MLVNSQSERIKAARELRERLLRDEYRPGYHFAIPEDVGLPGDPNGAFYSNGRYHLMYLYDRRGVHAWKGRGFCWGHISSHDLVHWRHHPDSLAPGQGDGGCFSGGAFVDDDGTAYLSFWRLPRAEDEPNGTGIGVARSSDHHYEVWEKLHTPSLDGTRRGIMQIDRPSGEYILVGNADPSNIWKKDGMYYLQAGNLPILDELGRDDAASERFRGDWVDLFSSSDLVTWKYVHRFYKRDRTNRWTDETEDAMCPSFLPLPTSPDGGRDSGKYLQLFISHNKGCQYYIGVYDTRDDRFLPERHGRMSWADSTFFAPEALVDDRGRQIMWTWLRDDLRDSPDAAIRDGWSGVYSLPRVLWLAEDDTLRMAPVPELQTLRYNERRFDDLTLEGDGELQLSGIYGCSCEISLSMDGDADQKGLRVRTSPDGSETTLVYYDAPRGRLVFDATRGGITPAQRKFAFSRIEEAPLVLGPDEPLELRVFVDNSVIEVFANDRQAITRRVYPQGEASNQVRLFCRGGSGTFRRIQTWEMMPSNPH